MHWMAGIREMDATYLNGRRETSARWHQHTWLKAFYTVLAVLWASTGLSAVENGSYAAEPEIQCLAVATAWVNFG